MLNQSLDGLIERVERARAFIEDTMSTQWCSRGAIGNLMAARDEIDAALATLRALQHSKTGDAA